MNSELQLALEQTGALTTTALHLPAGVSEDRLLAIGTMLIRTREMTTFATCDLLIYARNVGDDDGTYIRLVEHLGLNFHTWDNRMSICRNVRPDVRREELSFEHHDVVRALAPADQRHYLNMAVENGWSRERLRDEIHGPKVLPPAVSDDLPDIVRDTLSGAKQMMDGWLISRDSYQRLRAALGETDG